MDCMIPVKIRDHELVTCFTDKLVELILAIDDYYVTKRKVIVDDNTSRVFSYLKEKGGGLQEAFDNQYEYVMDLYKQCNDLKDRIDEHPGIESEELSASMSSVFNYNYALFKTMERMENWRVSSEGIIDSPVWDQFDLKPQALSKIVFEY